MWLYRLRTGKPLPEAHQYIPITSHWPRPSHIPAPNQSPKGKWNYQDRHRLVRIQPRVGNKLIFLERYFYLKQKPPVLKYGPTRANLALLASWKVLVRKLGVHVSLWWYSREVFARLLGNSQVTLTEPNLILPVGNRVQVFTTDLRTVVTVIRLVESSKKKATEAAGTQSAFPLPIPV